MKLILHPPAKALLPAYRVQNVERGRLEQFKIELARLLQLLQHSAQESEEHLKNIVSDFLKAAFYREAHFVNTKDRQDLVIHHGRTAKDPVGVIIEAKRPGNKAEMLSPGQPNSKALHELLRYYLNERNQAENKEIRHLIITDIHSWYLFDAADFERQVYANKKLLQQYNDWSEGRLGAGNTDWFYKEIAAPFFEKELSELRCCYFDLHDFAEAATNSDPTDDDSLLDLYKVLSPEHLLKKSFANDSNTLNKKFYDELLYILGLEEVKEKSKKIIDRAGKNRHDGSLLENTLSELEVSGVWRDVADPDQFGDTPEQQRFSIALELCITWLNRILFLKLLEGQLLRWNTNQERLLSPGKVSDFDELNELFFHVLAVPDTERRQSVAKKFGNIPYLNSSLFEQTELERRTLRISSLKDRLELPLAPNTVLLDGAGKRRSGRLSTLHYLFDFLDAYDFSSDAKARIQADNRDVINASVLGLIFEKINGYRDGSFFTPGFITMYMCRETLRRAVLQKFNERYGWECQNIETDLHNEIVRQRISLDDANALVNSLRICDPAVGSGHFLVSALNELIAIKSDLGILCDTTGKLLPLRAVVGNDELILTDPNTDTPFEYKPGVAASQRIQETLFHEKQTLIENCLFGVDINPKSVMICRLRLWVELLKHAYFKKADGKLETLPNIDINIKAGNSLISRFTLDEDLKAVFAKGKIKANDYRMAVAAYKNATDKSAKAQLLEQIAKVKSAIYESFYLNNPLNKKLNKLKGDRFLLENKAAVGDLFEKMKSADISNDLGKLNKQIETLEAQIEELKQGKTYRNSFEWRFEFPEVLDDAGNYLGFDAVLGNPPYIRQEELKPFKEHFQKTFETYAGTADLYVYFVERGMTVLRPGGQFNYILPNKWMRAGYGAALRQFVKRHRIEGISDFGDLPVFEEATTYPCLLELSRAEAVETFPAVMIDTLEYENSLNDYIRANAFTVGLDGLNDSGWTLTNQAVQRLLEKIRAAGTPLGEYVQGKIYYGIKTGLNEAFVIDADTRERLLAEDPKSAEVIKPFLAGRDIKRYQTPVCDKYLILFEKGVTNRKRGELSPEVWIEENFPAIFKHLRQFERKASERYDKGDYWWELRACDYYEEFEKPKIMLPDIAIEMQALYDNTKAICVNTAYLIPLDDKYLLGILNSAPVLFFYANITSSIRGGYFRFISQYLIQIPIPKCQPKEKQKITSLVDEILLAKKLVPQANTDTLEAELNRLVCGLYGVEEETIESSKV